MGRDDKKYRDSQRPVWGGYAECGRGTVDGVLEDSRLRTEGDTRVVVLRTDRDTGTTRGLLHGTPVCPGGEEESSTGVNRRSTWSP